MKAQCWVLVVFFLGISYLVMATSDTTTAKVSEMPDLIDQAEQQWLADSVRKADLMEQINRLKANENSKRQELLSSLFFGNFISGCGNFRHNNSKGFGNA